MVTSPTDRIDPSHNLFAERGQSLDPIFRPRRVAVVGASESLGSVGRTLLWNLISSPFGGTVFPVNPRRSSVLGIKAYPSLRDLPEPVDLAVIATPATTVPQVVRDCVETGVPGAIIISAGFKEIGAPGLQLEEEIRAIARGRMRIIGPNCLGVMNPIVGMNATFAATMARPGNVGFISQSGALCTSILDWSLREKFGFSAFLSLGSMLDVSWGDLIDYLGDDPNTRSIVIYMESIGDARGFLSAAREVALTKPIVVIKAGRTEAAAQAAASHTGAMTGSDEVLDAAFRRCGVLRVDSILDLFNMADLLAKQPRPRGKRLTILTNAGGPGVLATDALIRGGGELAPLGDRTRADLDPILPPHWSHANPIDILGDADPVRYAQSLEIAAREPDSDGLLVILTPQAMTDPTAIARQLSDQTASSRKPVLASWMGGTAVREAEAILNEAGIFTFRYPDTAAHIFNLMWQYSDRLTSLYETPAMVEEEGLDRAGAEALLQRIEADGRSLLTELESKQLLAAYGIPTVPTRLATDPDQAVSIARDIGYPVVLKLHSTTITHKTDVGGVQLNLADEAAVRAAYRAIAAAVGPADFLGVTVQPMVSLDGYELIIGSSLDPQFGPVLLFGSGGQLVEVYRDRALGLPPLNRTLARRLMERTRIWTALQGVRGRSAVDLAGLESLLVRFSQLVLEQPLIREIEINPLLAQPGDGLLALDARVVLQSAGGEVCRLPRPAIRPYPSHYQWTWEQDGEPLTIRPIRPEDEPAVVTFHEQLSEETVYFRYAHLLKLSQRIRHDRLTRICFIDYDREMALVAEDAQGQLRSVGRWRQLHGRPEAELSLLVADPWQNHGLGHEMVQRLVQVARQEGLQRLFAIILPENQRMRHLCEEVGFTVRHTEDVLEAELYLG